MKKKTKNTTARPRKDGLTLKPIWVKEEEYQELKKLLADVNIDFNTAINIWLKEMLEIMKEERDV